MSEATVELPPGYSAWTKDGGPVRRVATAGNPNLALDPCIGDLSDVPTADVFQLLWTDRLLYGDAWVGLDGRRVHPPDVVVVRD